MLSPSRPPTAVMLFSASIMNVIYFSCAAVAVMTFITRVPKHERRFTGFDEKIPSIYARGMSMRVSPGLISQCDQGASLRGIRTQGVPDARGRPGGSNPWSAS
jgi:hypothetical protein